MSMIRVLALVPDWIQIPALSPNSWIYFYWVSLPWYQIYIYILQVWKLGTMVSGWWLNEIHHIQCLCHFSREVFSEYCLAFFLPLERMNSSLTIAVSNFNFYCQRGSNLCYLILLLDNLTINIKCSILSTTFRLLSFIFCEFFKSAMNIDWKNKLIISVCSW